MSGHPNSNAKGALFALLAFAIFASHDVIVKILGAELASIQIVFFSVLFGFPMASVMLIGDGTEGNLRPHHPWWGALRVAATVVTGMSIFYAFTVLPLAQVYAVIFASPLIITILSVPILGETVRLRRWVAVIVGLGGVLVVLRPGSAELTLGHAAAIVGAFSSALASIIVRKIGRDERSVVLMLMPMLGNFLVMGALLPLVYKPMQIVDVGLLASMSMLGFIASLLIIQAYKSGEAVVVAPMQYSQIIWAALFGALLFDETLDMPTIVGAAIVIGSGIYIVAREGGGSGSATTPVLRTRTRFETGTWLRTGYKLGRRKQGR